MDEPHYWLIARDKPALLIAMMHALAGGARISFEGNLSRCKALSHIPDSSEQETATLKRATIDPPQDFAVIPLEGNTIRPILEQVLPEGRIVHDIIHIQIERNGKIEFASYDNFHRDCIIARSGVPRTRLENLCVKGVLRSFELAPTLESS